MKITNYLYADFETTKIKLPSEFNTMYEYYKNNSNPIVPKIYAWSIIPNEESKWVTERIKNKNKWKFYKHTTYKNDNAFYGIRGKDFLTMIESISTDTIIYFNNLKGFDGHYIIPLLDKNGYKSILPYNFSSDMSDKLKSEYKSRINRIKKQIFKNKKNKDKFESFKTKEEKVKWLEILIRKRWRKLLPKEYSLMINGNSQIYEIKIGVDSLKRTNGNYQTRAVIIRDNLLLFPTSIYNAGKTLAKYHTNLYGMNKNKAKERFYKLDLNTEYKRTELYKSFSEFENDGNELKYVFQDVWILKEFHKSIESYFPRKEWKMTIGSTAYKLWIKKFGEKLVEKMVSKGEIEIVKLKRGAIRYKEKSKDKLYPTATMYKILIDRLLPTNWMNKTERNGEKVWNNLYAWYKGGITHINEKYRGKILTNITLLDINSSYPSQQIKNVKVPIGRGVRGKVKGYDFFYYTLIPKKRIYNHKGLPFLFSTQKEKREWSRVLKPNHTYKLTTITLPRFLKYYDSKKSDYILKVEWSFNSISINKIFGEFVKKWYGIKLESKENGNKIIELIAKLFLNSVYGKLGTKIIRESMYWDQNISQFIKYIEEIDAKFYLPLAISITELGQCALIDAVDFNYDNFVYCDTDSIFVLDFNKEKYNIPLHNSKLGYWDIEIKNGTGLFRRPKQYKIMGLKFNKQKNKWVDIDKLVYSGINFNRYLENDLHKNEINKLEKIERSISFEDMIYGKEIDNQLIPYKIIGTGIVLSESVKQIKPIWSYDPLEEQTRFKKEHFEDTITKLKEIVYN